MTALSRDAKLYCVLPDTVCFSSFDRAVAANSSLSRLLETKKGAQPALVALILPPCYHRDTVRKSGGAFIHGCCAKPL